MVRVEKWFPKHINEKFSFYNYNHAAEILTQAFPEEFQELISALEKFEITTEDIIAPGGNESNIPRKINDVLDPLGWEEIRITGDLIIRMYPRAGKKGRFSNEQSGELIIDNFIDGHNIDFIKNKVAIDFEWNSKDQTFDRDLMAMRTYYECGVIDVGIIITRSEKLNTVFDTLNVKQKYGASTTWMGKLLKRLDSKRQGGCPILAISIEPSCIEGWEKDETIIC